MQHCTSAALALLAYCYIWESHLSFSAIICRFDVSSVQLQLSFPICSAKKKLGSWLLTFMSILCDYWLMVLLESLSYSQKIWNAVLASLWICLSFFFHHVAQSFAWAQYHDYPLGLPPSGQLHPAGWRSSLHAQDTAALPVSLCFCASAAATKFLTFSLFSTAIPTLKDVKLKQVGSINAGLC